MNPRTRNRSISMGVIGLIGLIGVIGVIAALSGCGENPVTPTDDGGVVAPPDLFFAVPDLAEKQDGGTIAPDEDLDKIVWAPSFDPDYNNLKAQPWVMPVDPVQRDTVSVFPDRLEFPLSATDVLTWEPGRLVVSAPGQGAGNNPMGFARRVVTVTADMTKITVATTSAEIEDIIQGDIQMQLKPDDGVPMDLTKADLDWVAQNLYYQDEDAPFLTGDSLTDDDPLPGDDMALFSFKSLVKAIGGAAKAVVKVAVQVYKAVTPATVSGSVNLSKELSFSSKNPLFNNLNFTKTIKTKKGTAMDMFIRGGASYDVSASFNPGMQFGAKIALPGHDANSEFWVNIDAHERFRIALDLALEAGIASAGGDVGEKLTQRIQNNIDFANEVLSRDKEAEEGDGDLKPAGGWKKTLYLSKPTTYTFAAGPVPVVITNTFQLDLECGFEAKASLNAHLGYEQSANFKFKANYNKGTRKLTIDGPTFDKASKKEVSVLGGGSVTVTCSLLPRVNVFAYDTVGLFTGLRGSLMAGASFKSKCNPDPRISSTTGEVGVKLQAGLALQVGARVQVPGSSYVGKKAQDLGVEIGPFEPWSTAFTLYEQNWNLPKGLGFCLPLCSNGGKDGTETDIDCGGSCNSCKVGKKCLKNSDCAASWCVAGTCSVDACGNGVRDGAETSIDCGGGKCKKCAINQLCSSGNDCTSGFCRASTVADPRVPSCVADHCVDNLRDDDEGGVDCGGATCAKCQTGVRASKAADCASGFWNGGMCVADSCSDLEKSGSETDVDCGGMTCKACPRGRACLVNKDCTTGLCDSGVCNVPVPLSTVPAKGAGGVDPTKPIDIAFVDALDPSTVNGTNVSVVAGMTPVSGKVTYSNKVIRFAPDMPLVGANSFTVTLGVGLTYANAVPVFTKPYLFTFSTGCQTGQADCNMKGNDGCEVTLANDKSNCGACGNACPAVPNGVAACTAGKCGLGSCNMGFTNCTGACLDLTTNLSNCGACGKVCPAVPNGVAACAAGVCGVASCNMGFASCGGKCTSVVSDMLNCGACGKACAIGQSCSNSACVATPPPALVPGNAAIQIDPATAITATFGADLDPASVTAMTVTVAGMASIMGTPSYANRVISFKPAAALPQNTTITVTLTTGIKYANGVQVFANNFTWSFNTLSNADLIAFWKFNGDGSDASGNGHTAVLNGGASYDMASHEGSGALSLDGSTGYVNVGAINLGNTFTISGWFFMPNPLQSDINCIMSNAIGGMAVNGFRLFVNSYMSNDQRLIFETGNGASGSGYQTNAGFVAGGQWSFFAFVVDRGNNQATFYWNGVAGPASGSVTANFGNNATTYIGRFANAQGYLKGKLDDLRIYNRLLSAQDIATISKQ